MERTGRQIDAELAQGAAQAVDTCGAGGLPLLAQAMQLDHGLLRFGFDRHRFNVVTPPGFEQGVGISTIVLVAAPIRPDMLGGQQRDLVAMSTELTRPVVSGAAGLEQHPTDRRLGHEGRELFAVEAVPRGHPARAVGHRDLETIFCQIDGKGSTLHVGLLLFVSWGLRHCQLGTWMPKKQEESISSVNKHLVDLKIFAIACYYLRSSP
jgi:hypothetical protein